MAVFSDFIKNISQVDCSNQATLTMGRAIRDGDTINLQPGCVQLSYESTTGDFGIVDTVIIDNAIIIDKEVDGDTVTIQFEGSGPFVIGYSVNQGTPSQTIAFYNEAIYFDYEESCDDCYSCDYINNGRLYNKKIKGLLTHSRYSTKHPQYMLDFAYNEDTKAIEMNDSALDLMLTPPTIDASLYSKFVILTYVSFDQDSGKFAEQIVYSSGINKDLEWSYEITSDPWKCWLHNNECIETTVEDDYTNATIIVEYITPNNSILTTSQTYPLLWTSRLDSENGSKYVDGIYKSYYFLVKDIGPSMAVATLNKGNVVRFKDVFRTMDYTLRAKKNYTVSTSTTAITILDGSTTHVINESNLEDLLDLFTVVEGNFGTEETDLTYEPMEMMKSIPDLICGELGANTPLREFVAEEMHIITYELAYEILQSIEDCSVPCERFSFDEWLGLRQKHLSANTNFCQGNIMKAALDLYTSRKRCKNC